MVSRWDRRLACAAVALVAAVALAAPSFAAAGSTEEGGAVLEPVATSPAEALAFWTEARRERAEPLPIVTLPEPAPEAAPELAGGTVQEAPAEVESAPTLASSTARAAAVGGTEVTAAESIEFPNSANGKILGIFSLSSGEGFECSGSLVAADVVLTAGHCLIDPRTGERAAFVVFIPGYNEGVKPLREWIAFPRLFPSTYYAFTKSWEQTVNTGTPNEGGDLAFVRVAGDVEKVIGGSLEVGFDRPCNQIYTQFGYPGEAPYDGEVLYSHTAPYAGPDSNPSFSPTPMKIASDFTKGASGGPWVVGPATSPTVLSLTAYGYPSQPGYLFGPYFGEAARKAYELASGEAVPIGIEESCKPLAVPVVTHQPAPAPPTPPPVEAVPPAPPVTLRLTRIRRRANGSAVLTARVSAAGKLKLSGAAVRAESVSTQGAGKYRLVVAPKRRTDRKLKRKGKAKVGVRVAFSASGRTKRVSKRIQLSRRSAARFIQRRTGHSH